MPESSDYEYVEELHKVPAEKLDHVIADFEASGAKVTVKREGKNAYTVVAQFGGDFARSMHKMQQQKKFNKGGW